MIEKIVMQNINKKILLWHKDKNSRYLYCNEASAEAAGVDSPKQMIGKIDEDFVWRSCAHLYREDDIQVMRGATLCHIPRPQPRADIVATLLNTKVVVLDKFDKPCGVTGYCIDITGHSIVKHNGRIDPQKNIFFLGEPFGKTYFTKREFEIFKYLLLGKSVYEIAARLCRSTKTVESQIKSIANKMQCTHKSEIAPTAIRYGLTYVLDDVPLEKKSDFS